MEIVPLQPIVIYVQASQPSDTTNGKLWLRTSDGSLFIAYNSAYQSTGLSGLQTKAIDIAPNAIIENALLILKLAVDAGKTATTYYKTDNTYCDYFSTASGASSTIDAGNTNAYFSGAVTGFLNATKGNNTTDNPTGYFSDSAGSGTGSGGYEISLNGSTDVLIVDITKDGACNATTAYVYDITGATTIGTATFSGNTATFSPSVRMTHGKTYRLLVDAGGGSYTRRVSGANQSWPKAVTNITYTGSFVDNASDLRYINISGVTTATISTGNTHVQTNALTIPTITANPSYFLIYCNQTLSGGGTMTADVSFDGGSTFTSGASINTLTTITSTKGSSLVIKFNLNGTGSAVAGFDDYGIIWFG